MEQNTPEWEAWRKTKIGASDIPIIMGESPYKTPYRLWQEKTGRATNYVTKAMEEGKLLEPLIRDLYDRKTGHAVFAQVIENPHYPNFIASLDGITLCGTHGCELKSANPEDHAIALSGKIPTKYYGQLQWHMFHTNLNKWDYFSYGKICKTTALVIVERDHDYILRAVEKALEFLRFMQEDIAPPHKEYETIVTDEEFQHFAYTAELIRERQILESLEKAAKEKCKEFSQGREIQAGGIRIEKTAGRSYIDYDNIPALSGIDLEQYRKTGKETWRITLKDEK